MTSLPVYSDFHYDSSDGLKLHARIYPARNGAAPPIVCLPGLTRNARDFHWIARYLSEDAPVLRKVIVFDYRGRGGSAYDPTWQNYTVPTELGDVLAGLAALNVYRAAFIGTSRGGLILHVMAAIKPDLIAASVLNDIGPVIEREGLDRIRAYVGAAKPPTTVDEAIAVQRRTHGADFPALDDGDWARMVEALYRFDDAGRVVLDYDPALANILTSADPNTPLPELWPQFDLLATKPMLVIRGANSMLLSEATLAEMARRGPPVETVTVDGQGHAPILDTGDLPRRIAGFFDRALARD